MRNEGAVGRFVASVRKDHEAMVRHHAKYGGRSPEGAPIARDVVEKIGFQMLAAYRVMRLLRSADQKLGAQLASRLIRHLYASDIHWDADIAPGIMIVHGMGMAISRSARIDEDVVLFQHCTLGEGRHPETGEVGAPHVERGVVVGAGATLLGPITIGAGSKIMPGCVVVRSVPPNSIVEAPAAIVRARARSAASDRGDANGGRQ
jgi:serine O-acetyltransferase